MASVTKENPQRTVFAGIEEAKQFIFDLDGSCGYDYGWDMLSFQKIDYPPWDMYFCHECSYKFRDLSATSLARQDFGTCHSRATFEGSADGSDLSH